MNNLVYIPFRITKDIAIGEELRRVIKRDYYQSPSIFENDLSQLTKIRKKIVNLKDEQVDKSLEIFLRQYYVQVVNLTKKFNNEIIMFEWYGTLGYKPSGPYKLRSLKFEQYNIIYQLGSFFAQLAIKENRFTEEGLKRSCNYFQMSAGCFEILNEIIDEDNFIMDEFSNDSLQFLKYLMLAQAQETIWQKSINSEMKNSIIVKLSIETSNLYSKCIEYGNKSDFIKLEYINHCTIKHYHFHSASNYRLSLMSLENQQYGQQVAYLRKSLELSEKGLKYQRYVKNYVVEDLKGLNEMIGDSLKTAERDNDLIYHKPIPTELPVTQGAFVVNTIKIEELRIPLESDRLFLTNLLPYKIIQISLAYKERQDSFILQRILEPLQSLNKMMNHFLTERELPASIDAIQKPENIPELIIQHSQDIISYGGAKAIENLYDTILTLSSDCRDIYEGCSSRLTIEEEEDQFFRQKYNELWDRQTSKSAGEMLWNKINSMDDYLDQADKADDIILSNYHQIKGYLQLYQGGYESLSKFIPNSTLVSLKPETRTVLIDIREALNETQELELSRKNFLKKLENKSKDNNILPKLIDYYKKNDIVEVSDDSFEALYAQHIKVFNEDLEFVEVLKNKQMVLENKIDELNSLFINNFTTQENEDSNSDRRSILQVLENAYSRYLQLITNLNEAAKFYNDFKTKGLKVVHECDEFVNNRRKVARDLELKLSPNSEPISQPSNQLPKYDIDYDDSDSDEEGRFEGPRIVTPIPIVASPVPMDRNDNSTPLTKELNELQNHFNQTRIRK